MFTQQTLDLYFLGHAKLQLAQIHSLSRNEKTCNKCSADDGHRNVPVALPARVVDALSSSLAGGKNSLYACGDPPILDIELLTGITCLHVSRALDSALEQQNTEQRCWNVDIYDTAAPSDFLEAISSNYCKWKLSDGAIYLNYRIYERRRDSKQSARFLDLLPHSKQRNVRQISNVTRLKDILQEMEAFPNLWEGFHISSFPTILSWRCHDEIFHYFNEMLKVWKTLVGTNYYWCDSETVKTLQGLYPELSLSHRQRVLERIHSRRVFHRVHDETERQKISDKIVKLPGPLLSFSTFFSHVRILDPAMINLRRLIPPIKPKRDILGRERSIKDAFRDIFTPNTESDIVLAQISPREETTIWAPRDSHFQIAYWQLCLSFVRAQHKSLMPRTQKQWEKMEEFPVWLEDIATLAFRLGFKSPEISKWRNVNCSPRKEPRFWSQCSNTIRQIRLEADVDGPCDVSMTCSGHEQSGCNIASVLFMPSIKIALQRAEPNMVITDTGQTIFTFISLFGPPPHATHRNPTISQAIATSSLYTQDSGNTPIAFASQHINSESPTSRKRTIAFWELQETLPHRITHNCEATEQALLKTLSNISSNDRNKFVWLLLPEGGKLKLTTDKRILNACVYRRSFNNVYYTRIAELVAFWAGKELDAAQQWVAYYEQD